MQATSIADAPSSGGNWVGDTWTPAAAGSVVSASQVVSKLTAGSHVTVLTHAAAPSPDVRAALQHVQQQLYTVDGKKGPLRVRTYVSPIS